MAIDDVHRWSPDEACDKAIRRSFVTLLGARVLLHTALVHDDEAIRKRHRLLLVVRHVDDRRRETPMQHAQLRARFDAQACVEIREWFIEEKDLWIARNRAANRHALPLSARKFARIAMEQRIETKRL